MRLRRYRFYLFLLLYCLQPIVLHADPAQTDSLSTSVDAGAVPEKKRVQSELYLTPADARHAMETRADVVFIDVRDPGEFQFVGFPNSVSANIPFLLIDDALAVDSERNQYKMVPNSNFVSEVADYLTERSFDQNTHIIVQCRSGGRSAKAANVLISGGYANVWQQVEGMEGDKDEETGHRILNGWKNAGLPWTYALTPDVAYQPGKSKEAQE